MNNTAPNPTPPLKVGDYAPDFSAPTDGGGNFSLSSYRGKKNIVIYFYPKDDTPGCTIEGKEFSSTLPEFQELDTIVIGISKDDTASHDKFKEKHCLTIPLAYDETGTICEAYDCWVEKSMYGKKYMGIQRSTFLVDKKGVIRKIWQVVKVEGHVKEVLKETEKL